MTCEVMKSLLFYVWTCLTFYLQSFMLLFWIGLLGGSDSNVMDDDQIILDPSSNLGVFIRRCLLAFNLLSFEVLLNYSLSCQKDFALSRQGHQWNIKFNARTSSIILVHSLQLLDSSIYFSNSTCYMSLIFAWIKHIVVPLI